jgi:hypothetical protein
MSSGSPCCRTSPSLVRHGRNLMRHHRGELVVHKSIIREGGGTGGAQKVLSRNKVVGTTRTPTVTSAASAARRAIGPLSYCRKKQQTNRLSLPSISC